jgi:hypothetical protein
MGSEVSTPLGDRALVREVVAAAAFSLLGIAAVLALPSLGSRLPRGGDAEPNAAQSAVTALGILVLTAAYLSAVARGNRLSRTWTALAFGYCSGIAIIKFVLSPASFHNTSGTTLSRYLVVGLVILAFYGAGLWAVYRVARQHRGRAWAWPSKVAMVGMILVFAVVSRYLAVVALGTGTGEYLKGVLRGRGLVLLLVVLAGSSAAAIESFEHAGRSDDGDDGKGGLRGSLRAGFTVLAVYHGLWAIYMLRLFD